MTGYRKVEQRNLTSQFVSLATYTRKMGLFLVMLFVGRIIEESKETSPIVNKT